MESSQYQPRFALDGGRDKDVKAPEFALVLGSGASLLEVHEHRDRLRKLAQEDILVIGVNYSYRVYVTLQHVFLDWEMWSQNFYDLSKLERDFGTMLIAPVGFDQDRIKASPCVPLPATTIRFSSFICATLQCPHCVTKKGKLKEQMSDHWVKGLRGSCTSVMPAINLAYLTGTKKVAIIGVEMDTARHYWQTKEWMNGLKGQMPHADKWHKMTIDVWGAPPEHKFPNADTSLADIESVGKWMRKKGVTPINLATKPPGAVKSWDRMTLDELLTQTEKKLKRREYMKQYRSRKKEQRSAVSVEV